jgi:hypothetical protein
MKIVIMKIILLISLSISIISCGISKEIKGASSNLVEKQKTSLEAHKTFHTAVINTINMYLDSKLDKSKRDYSNNISGLENILFKEIDKTYKSPTMSEANKVLTLEKLRIKYRSSLQKQKESYDKKKAIYTKAKTKLVLASANLLKGEKYKISAIKNMDKYLQQKRPEEKLLEMVGIDLNKYSEYVDDANKAIGEAEKFIDKLK